MSQLSLFEPGEAVLCDDEWGRITYAPVFVPPSVAAAWFIELRHAVPWKAERRWMYERRVDVPRLIANFALELPGSDERETAATAQAGSPPQAVLYAARHVIRGTGARFNSVGLNLYRDGHDSVAPHNDHLDEIAEGHPIAVVSLGATRRMTIRAKPPRRRVWHVDLEAGSLLLMSYATQLHYTHAVPKAAGVVGERISLAFRVKAADAASRRRGLYGVR